MIALPWKQASDSRLRVLRDLPELAPFSDLELRQLLPHLDEVVVPAGASLAVAGRFCSEYLVILDGSLEATGPSGLRRLGAGASVGWRAMWERAANPETLVTLTSTRLLVMGRAEFRAVAALGRRADLDLSA